MTEFLAVRSSGARVNEMRVLDPIVPGQSKGVSRVLCGFGEDLRRLGHPLHLRGISVVHLVDNGIAWNTITCFLDI